MPHYNQPHQYYCGVDLHARSLYVHILDDTGRTRLEQNLAASPSSRTATAWSSRPARPSPLGGSRCRRLSFA